MERDVKYTGPLAREMALRAEAEAEALAEFGFLDKVKNKAADAMNKTASKLGGPVVSDPAGAGGNPYHDPGSGRFTGPEGGGGGAAAAPPGGGVPAGWHPDPTGRHTHRYWDGSKWTEDVGDNGVQGKDADLTPKVAVPPPPPPAAAAPAAGGSETREQYLARVNATQAPVAEKKGFWAQAKADAAAKRAAPAPAPAPVSAPAAPKLDRKAAKEIRKQIEQMTKEYENVDKEIKRLEKIKFLGSPVAKNQLSRHIQTRETLRNALDKLKAEESG